MKILILGAAGNLGTALSEICAHKEDLTVIAWDKADIDVTDEGLVQKKVSEILPDVIINLVAYNDVDGAEKDAGKKIATTLNVALVKSLATIALNAGALFIHYSSDYVFRGDQEDGYKENDEPSPINVYGQTKLDGEKELAKLAGRGLRWYLIRTSKLFGPKGTSKAAKPNFFELMYNLSKQAEPIKVISDEGGSFTYTLDLAQATLELIEHNNPLGVYHLINDGGASWFKVADYFFKKLNRTVELQAVSAESFTRVAKRPKHSLLLNTKGPALRTWQTAVDDYILHEHFI